MLNTKHLSAHQFHAFFMFCNNMDVFFQVQMAFDIPQILENFNAIFF